MSAENTAAVASEEVVVAAMNADALGVPLIDEKRPGFHYLPKVKIEGKEVTQDATFLSVNEKGRVSASYQVTLWQPMDALTMQGKSSVPGTGFLVKFVGGKYSTPFKEVADALRALPDFMTKYRPNPVDPTGYWQVAGVVQKHEEVVVVTDIIPDGLPENVQVKRGARAAGDQAGKA